MQIKGGGYMAVFQSEKEVYELLGDFFEQVKNSPAAKEVIKAAEANGAIVTFKFTEPTSSITWKAAEDGESMEVVCGESDVQPELILEMTADIAHQFWLGGVDLARAVVRQQIKATGPLSKALMVVPHLDAWKEVYKRILKEKGREDLLVNI
jgi:hypothetical protein